MVYHSNGGFNWNDLYYMPTNLREFYFAELLKIKDKEKESQDKAFKAAQSKKGSPSKTMRR